MIQIPASARGRAGRDTTLHHRPPRTHPDAPPYGDIVIVPPPALADHAAASSWLQFLVPAVGSAGSLVFVLFFHNLLFLVIAGGMVVLSVGLGLVLRFQQGRAQRRRARVMRERYLRYLGEREEALKDAARTQTAILEHLHPDLAVLRDLVDRRDRLWERRPGDADFLHIRCGRGAQAPACPPLLDLGSDPLVEHDADLLGTARLLVGRYTSVPDVPVVVDLVSAGTVAVTGSEATTRGLVRSMLCELAAFHSAADVRVVAGFDAADRLDWEWLKWLPHAREKAPAGHGVSRPPRCYLAGGADALRAVIDEVLVPRLAARGDAEVAAPVAEHIILVIDGFTPALAAAIPELDRLMGSAAALHLTVVALCDRYEEEPSQAGLRLATERDGSLDLWQVGPPTRRTSNIVPDRAAPADCEAVARLLAPLRLVEHGSVRSLADDVRLFDMIAGSTPDAPAAAWSTCDPAGDAFLRAPLGVRENGAAVILDLKEAAHEGMGPHGLVVGATGSGKSELLRSLVTGLAATHPPELLGFVFVDFKGGAAFADLERLPHSAGLVTNLRSELTMVDRVREALSGEMDRRQRLLRDAGNLDGIREYLARRVTRPALEPMPYLLVIVDEFGELLAGRPDFLDLFVAIGRLGRSLGLHLLLATQRLEEGRIRGLEGHLRYRICLRTFSAQESSAVLGTPDAYRLPPYPGAAYLKVDTTTYERFKAALVSLPYRAPAGPASRLVAEFVPLATGAWLPDKAAAPGAPIAPERTEMDVAVDGLAEEGVRTHQVWLPPLPERVTLDGVLAARDLPDPNGADGDPSRAGGAPDARPVTLAVPIGLADLPAEQRQEPLVLDLGAAGGHLAVVGAPQSGKSTLLQTIVAALTLCNRPEDVQFYCLDLGGGGLHALSGAPHVGAVCGRADPEGLTLAVSSVEAVIHEREQLFREHAVDSMATFRRRRREDLAGATHGDVFLVIDDWARLRHDHEQLADTVAEVAATGPNFGVHVILATGRWADLRAELRERFGSRLELALNDPLESEHPRAIAASLPSGVPGRGLTADGRHFQVALPRVDGRPETATLHDAVLELTGTARRRGGRPAPQVRALPVLVTRADIAGSAGRGSGVVVGVEETRGAAVRLDLLSARSPHFLAFGDGECGKTNLLRLWLTGASELYEPAQLRVLLVDYRRALTDVARGPLVDTYACTSAMTLEAVSRLRETLSARLPRPDATPDEVLAGVRWTGPRHVVVCDDFDLVSATPGHPLTALVDLVPQARDVGLHIILARRVAGSARTAFEPLLQRLREVGSSGLVMSGDAVEGPLLGSERARPMPPGRGRLVVRHRPTVGVQTLFAPIAGSPDEATTAVARGGEEGRR